MLTVTEPATARLNEMLGGGRTDTAVRIFVRDGRLRARRDRQRPGDTTFGDGRRTLLILGRRMSRRLDAMTLETRATKKGPRLRLQMH